MPTVTATHTDPAPAIFTTEATVSKNKIEIEIHEDIYAHIGQYLATGDYFHAVEESYKLVREKLREITGKEKAHTPAAPLERKLAVHYISLASLSYDLITRYVSEETIRAIEDLVLDKRRSYPSASTFYRDFDGGKWLRALKLPVSIASSAVRKVLKQQHPGRLSQKAKEWLAKEQA